MKTFSINELNVRKLYAKADAEAKNFMEEIFGKENLFKNVTDRIKTWEDAAAEQGIDPVESLPFKNAFLTSCQAATNAFFKLDIIAEVLNEGTILDWTNKNQKKWYPWFNDYKPGSGFSFDATYYVWTNTATIGGARLCVHSIELAEYFGKQFLPLFNQFLNPNK